MLATAESCTGGFIASLLTDVEGLSHGFDMGLVTYSDHAKTVGLGIEPLVIERAGAVSEEVARLMAQHVLAQSQAVAAVAVTGYIGGAPADGENGLVHILALSRSGHSLHRECHFGDVGREEGRDLVAKVALDLLAEVAAR